MVKEIIEIFDDLPRKHQVTSLYLVDVYRGSMAQKIRQNGHDKLRSFGKASHLMKSEVERKILFCNIRVISFLDF